MHSIILLHFFAASIGIYSVNEVQILIIFAIIACFLLLTMQIVKTRSININFQLIAYYWKPICAFTLLLAFTFAINYAFDSYDNALVYTFRAIVMAVLTLTIIVFFGTYGLSRALEGIIRPLSLFGVNVKRLSLMITLGITLIPVLMHDARQIRAALKAKGHHATFHTMFKDAEIVLVPYFELLFLRLHAYEKALEAKGV